MTTFVGMINVPSGVGEDAWEECFHIMNKACGVFGINEALYRKQKRVYAALARKNGLGVAGLRPTPNPIFFDKTKFRKISQRTVKLHGRGPRYNEFKGFNSERFANVLVLENRETKERETHINVHLAAKNNAKVPNEWVARMQKESLKIIKGIVINAVERGDVYLYGDFNIHRRISFGALPHISGEAIKAEGVDKMFRFWKTPKGTAKQKAEFAKKLKPYKVVKLLAPTDHKHGYVAKPAA